MKKPFEDLLLLACCTFLLSICAACAEALFHDWLSAGKDFTFGLIALVAFLIAQWMYIPGGSQSETSSLAETEPCTEILSRKEAFAANVLTIANPLAEPHDFAYIPLYETERIIMSGRYRLELVKSSNEKPVLVLCEE
jgi:hypothetical protein